MTAFSTLNVLPPAQLTNLNELGYLTMTPVQAAALPAILAGKDVRVPVSYTHLTLPTN